jgi:hypothetical protein
VVRNDSGEAVAAGAGYIVAVAGAMQAETFACRQALLYVQTRG